MRTAFFISLLAVANAAAWGAPKVPRIDTVSLAADQGWAGNPDLIWYDDFDSGSVGGRYLEYDNNGGDFVPVTYEALGGAGQSMRARWQVGEVGAGSVKKSFGRNPADYKHTGVRPTEDFRDVYWRMYVKMQDGWQGNPAKLSRAISFAGSNWSEAMIAHVWGGNTMDLLIDPARGVNSSSQVVTTKYNDFANLTWLGYRDTSYQIFSSQEAGRWVCVEAHAKLNTPGLSDGIFTLTIDGQVAADRRDLNWVYSWQAYGINSVFLENYWNSGSPVLQERYMDDFVISTAPIGLARSPVRPTVRKTTFSDDVAGQTQAAWQVQAATDISGSQLVWDSGVIAGASNSTTIGSGPGTFLGPLAGRTCLAPDTVYALRTRQQDTAGAWSAWSPWMTVLRTAPALPGDANRDGITDMSDYIIWFNNFGQTSAPGVTNANWQKADFNGDGITDMTDYVAWFKYFGDDQSSFGVPEPATLALLALGLPLLRRRRR